MSDENPEVNISIELPPTPEPEAVISEPKNNHEDETWLKMTIQEMKEAQRESDRKITALEAQNQELQATVLALEALASAAALPAVETEPAAIEEPTESPTPSLPLSETETSMEEAVIESEPVAEGAPEKAKSRYQIV